MISFNDIIAEMPDYLEELILERINELSFNDRYELMIYLKLGDEIESLVQEINEENEEGYTIVTNQERLL